MPTPNSAELGCGKHSWPLLGTTTRASDVDKLQPMYAFIAGLALLFPHASATPNDLIADVRKALTVEGAGWSSTVLSGQATYYGVACPFTIQFDKDGKFLQVMKGPLGESYGYDGKQFWEADRSGAPRILNFEDVDVQEATMVLQTGQWLDPDSGIKLAADGYNIHLTLPSGFEETVAINSSNDLPTSATFIASPGEITVGLADWKPAGNRLIPYKTTITEGGLTDTFAGDTAKESKPGDYALPSWTPSNITFDPAKPASIEAKKLITGHIIVHPLVNGKDVGWFILDSGADIMVIDPKVADKLNLPKIGELPLVGVGGIVKESFRPVDKFELGPATLTNTEFSEFDLGEIGKALNIDLAGIVGFDFFRRSIVSVDLDKPAVSIFNPNSYKLSDGGWTQLKFDTGNPAVQATVKSDNRDITDWYRLDTGASGTVQFHAPFVKKQHLLDNRQTEAMANMGAGGSSDARAGKIDAFELAGHKFDNPSVSFSQATVGAFADNYLAGNIGQEFMKPFTVIFDFGGSRVALVPKS